MKQNTEADPSSMMAESSHLISKMPERETGLPNTYDGFDPTLANEPDSGTKPEFDHQEERPAAPI